MRPVPRTASILFFLSRNSTPLTLPSTPSSLNFISAARSSFGVPTPMPILAKLCPASSNISEACSSAFDGMQPTLRQVPPWVARFSTTATFMAELRRADRADIAAGAGADDDEIVGHDATHLSVVMPGLDPASTSFSKTMDCRIKPGHDG